jgi:alpha-beta hydrolase superfamily lysophospholipase
MARRRGGRLLVGTLAVVVVLALALVLGGGWYYSDELLSYPSRTDAGDLASQERALALHGLTADPMTIDGPLGRYTGLLIDGGADTWIVMVHGRGGALVEGDPLARTLADTDMPVLFTSFRNDGFAPDAPDGHSTFGSVEWRDLQAWVDAAQGVGAESIVLYGFSMGGSVVASFLQRSPDADLVDAVILDSPMLSMHRTLELQAEAFGIAPPLVPPLLVGTKAVSSVRADIDFAALEHVDRWAVDLPALLIHGTGDTVVPDEPTVELAEQLGSDATLMHPEGVGHVEYRDVGFDAYRAALVDFLGGVP